MQTENGPVPLQETPKLEGQNCYLFAYVLFDKPGENDPLGLVKVMSVHKDIEAMKTDFKRCLPTNEGINMKWGVVGHWEVLRRPEGDTDATYDIVRTGAEDAEEDFMGEKLTRDVIKPTKNEEIKDRAAIDQYKENYRMQKLAEKKIELRKKAMKELQTELDDPTALASYAQLHWQRLTQKSMIAEQREKLQEVQKSLRETLEKLRQRNKEYPHYEPKWQNEIRRIHKMMMPNKEKENPVDQPHANLGDEDDYILAGVNPDDPTDEFDQGIGVEAKGKGKEEADDFEVRLSKDHVPPTIESVLGPAVSNEENPADPSREASFLPNEAQKNKPRKKKNPKASYRKGRR